MSPPDRGGGGGRGLQPGRDAAVGRGTAMPGAPAHPVTPGLAALGCRDARGGHAGGGRDPPGKGEASGGRGDTQHAGGTGGTRPCVAAVGDTGVRGGPALCWVGGEGGGERTHMATQAPRPPPGALSPPRCSPGELCPYLRSPQRCSPCRCHSSVAGTVGAAVFPLRGAGGKDGAPMGRVGSGDPRWLRGRGAGWGPGTPTGSASHEPSAGGWVTVGLGQTPRGSGWIGGGRGVAGAQVGPAKRSA